MLTNLQHLKRFLIATALLCGGSSAVAGVVMHDVVVTDASVLSQPNSANQNAISIQLSAMGTDIHLALEASRFNRLLQPYRAAEQALPTMYQGVIAGDPNSWARVSIVNGTISGNLYYFGKLLQLDSRAFANKHFAINSTDSANTSDVVIIEPATSSDAAPLLDRFSGATDKLVFAPTYNLSDSVAFRQDKIRQAVTTNRDGLGTAVTRTLRIGIVVDSRFNEAHQNRGLARALSIINSVDAIYQSQLGIAIIVEGIRVYDDPATDPMRDNGELASDILANFREVRMADERLPNDLTLVHLFSGHRDPDRVIGLGGISTACRLDGFDISMSTPFPFDALLAAHEMAHNLGALHDDDPQCLVDENRRADTIMWPQITGSSSTIFSACSTRDIQDSKYASCNLDNIDASIRLHTHPTNENLRRSVVVEVTNKDRFGRATELMSSTTFPAGAQFSDVSAGCTVVGNTVDCDHGTLQPGSTSSTSVTATLLSASGDNVIGEVDLLNASDILTQDNRAAVQMLQFDSVTGEAISGSSQLMVFDDEFVPTTTDILVAPRIGHVSLTVLLLLQCLGVLRYVLVRQSPAKRCV